MSKEKRKPQRLQGKYCRQLYKVLVNSKCICDAILKSATDMSVPLAMNQAQQWLRDATKEELQQWVKKLPLDSTKKGKIRRLINTMTGDKPFKSPYHWAAFTAVGK